MKPVVAIAGPPNAGKSTLFNRLTRSRSALVDDLPGVTRDRLYAAAAWGGVEFDLVDTGGFYARDTDAFAAKTHYQLREAIAGADAVILLFDGAHGISAYDRDLADLVREFDIPVFCAINKIDHPGREDNLYDFYALGMDTLYAVSTTHGHGINTLLDDLIAVLPKIESAAPSEPVRMAVIGRPNVGKSSLINRILGQERIIVSDTPGTTRDAIDTLCEVGGKPYMLIDTAGVRRKSRVRERIEKYAIGKALDSLDRCDIALIMLDAETGITEQDVRIAGYAYEKGRACIFLLNKWDLVEKNDRIFKQIKDEIRYRAGYLNFAPILTISALTGRRVPKIFEFADAVYQQYTRRIATGPLNRIIESATTRTEPAMHHGRRLKFYYAAQTGIKPPTFVCFVNYPEGVHFSYQRYLVNQIRDAAGLDLVPVRLLLRKRGETRQRKAPKKKRPARAK
ncbi:MAG: ribosome biogenesis GTPase Der [Desulfobacterales bacterium]|nr:ribosome biogenesis GTPase Der [Desulfobacterales bacterium]MBS3755191.1 ribosome biogenesis GTPase Der [Desulfobacterales bacterium]